MSGTSPRGCVEQASVGISQRLAWGALRTQRASCLQSQSLEFAPGTRRPCFVIGHPTMAELAGKVGPWPSGFSLQRSVAWVKKKRCGRGPDPRTRPPTKWAQRVPWPSHSGCCGGASPTGQPSVERFSVKGPPCRARIAHQRANGRRGLPRPSARTTSERQVCP